MAKKKVLLISYHALPMDVVASYRAKAYCDYFFESDIYPTLITHRWELDNEDGWIYHNVDEEVLVEDYKHYKVIRLPRPQENNSPSTLTTFSHWLSGDFEMHLLNSYKMFKTFLLNHLKFNQYDCILSIFNPHYHIKLSYELNKQFNIPYILDFRDLWDNQMITTSYKPSFKKKFQDNLIKFYWKKWMKPCLFFSTTSNVWIDYLSKLSGKNGVKVTNGHEIDSVFEPISTKKFTLAYFGRMYPYQNFEVILKGIQNFLNCHKGINDFELLLIGIKKVNDFNGIDIFQSKLDNRYIKVINYMPKKKLIQYVHENASLFILPNLIEDNGSFFVKLFDYIALNKPIILAPSNNSENDEVAKRLNAGLVTASSDDVTNFLNKSYIEFVKTGKVKNGVKKNQVNYFHRSNQVALLANEINNHIN
ncbi:hypothetical protein [Marivirga sp.]|uniref:hypothetical protein n=1 Tax=Marivirga sp. TaxID=2018662 RepID=UPI003DA735E0